MTSETLQKLTGQLRPEAWIGLMVAAVALTLLAAYWVLLKPPLARYRELTRSWSPLALEGAVAGASENAAAIAGLEEEVEELRGQLYGTASGLRLEQMESYIIDRLDGISVQRDVQLVSVTPGEVGRVLMFDELPYDVAVNGGYFRLFDWLQAVEDELRPMVVKRFEMSPDLETERIEMKLRLVSYRPHEGKP